MKNNYTLKYLKITLLFLALLITNSPLFSQTTLTKGDIAFTRIQMDDESFSFVVLVPLQAGTEFYITDEAWDGSSLLTFESELKFTANSLIPAGEEVSYNASSNAITFSGGSVLGSIVSVGANFTTNMLGAAGDNLFIHQGSQGSPSVADFITGISANTGMSGTSGNAWQTSTSTSNTLLPSTLTNGADAVGLFPVGGFQPEVDNARYKPTANHSGDKATILAAIMTLSNWEFNNDVVFDVPTTSFTITTPCAEPDIPTVTSAPPTICDGNSALLSISGNKNDATEWRVYTGSCGGTLVATTTSSTVIVTPTPPSTTYYIRGEGGCVTPGSCGTITINTTPREDASFSYSASAYCVNELDPTPTITGVSGGTFSAAGGLSINPTTGKIDVSASTPNTYTVSYTTNGLCNGTETASITINASDDASFSYAAATYCADSSDPTPTITGLAGGTFDSTVGLSINGSTGEIDLSTSVPNTYNVTYTTTGTCPNTSQVSITINALDDASFSYSAATYCADGADPTPTIMGLAGGTFDSTAGLSINGSTGEIDLSASVPNTYNVTYTTTGTCPNTSQVSITINALDDASFSYGAATYCSSDTNPTPTITGLAGGTFSSTSGLTIDTSTGEIDLSTSTPNIYTVSYTTSGACPNNSSISVEITALTASMASQTNIVCNGGANGAATVTATGGTAPYTYAWSNGATTATITGVTAGTYNVTVTDANGCTSDTSVTITEPTALVASASVTSNYNGSQISCHAAADGEATAAGTGGTAPYTYSWNNGATTASITGVTEGVYTVTITDVNGCTDNASITITEPTALSASIASQTNVTCNGVANGSATVTATGGTASPYTYTWSNGATTASITGVTAGTYNVTVTDA
ncbi:SprB repeat-containing protein, partial [Algibacter pectinivorans]